MRPAGSGVLCSFEDSVAGRWTTFFGYFDSDRLDGTGRANGLRNYAPWNTMITLHQEHWVRSKLGGCYMLESCVYVNMREDAADLSIWSIGQVRRWGGGFGPWRTQCYGRSVWMTVNHTCERDRRVNFVLAVTGVAYNGTFGNTAITSISVTIKNDRRITGFSVIQFNI